MYVLDGGAFGVQTDRQDKSAVGWDEHSAPAKHPSQVDYKVLCTLIHS